MDKTLWQNLRRLQAFDTAVKKGKAVDEFALALLASIMFTADAQKRAAAIRTLERKTVDYFRRAVQPAAHRLGIDNAKDVLKHLGPGPDTNDAGTRRFLLVDATQRPSLRLKIMQALVSDRANTLENRLTAYWLEPGQSDAAKLQQLREQSAAMEARQSLYSQQLADWYKGGQQGSRPRKPQLDFLAKFQADVKQDLRQQARRTGTDAEIQRFLFAGHAQLVWIAVNQEEACPDCQKRNGMSGDVMFWDKQGRPGAGKTVCGANCWCVLAPSGTYIRFPNLRDGLNGPMPQ